MTPMNFIAQSTNVIPGDGNIGNGTDAAVWIVPFVASHTGTITNGTPIELPVPQRNLYVSDIVIVAKDTTSANITVKNDSSTVATLAKATTIGDITRATNLLNTEIVPGNTFTIETSATCAVDVIVTAIPMEPYEG